MTSLDTGVGGNNNIELGDGNNIGIGGAYDNTIKSGDGNDIVAGDLVEIVFFAGSTMPASIILLTTNVGGDDEIFLGGGDNKCWEQCCPVGRVRCLTCHVLLAVVLFFYVCNMN
jgi:hypothetical protein